jgi:cytochrome c553
MIKTKLFFCAASVIALCVLSFSAQAQDLNLGRTKAATACAVCHGPMGMAMQPGVPHLAGQPQIYLAEQLKNYRSGKRPHEVMAVIAKTLTDADIEALSHWYAAIAIKLE